MDTQLKKDFTDICKAFGIPVSTAITLFAKAVVREQKIPFDIKVEDPNSFNNMTTGKRLSYLRHIAIYAVKRKYAF